MNGPGFGVSRRRVLKGVAAGCASAVAWTSPLLHGLAGVVVKEIHELQPGEFT
jgi:hypothetical protein